MSEDAGEALPEIVVTPVSGGRPGAAFFVRGLLQAAAVGSVTGLVDVGRALGSANELITAPDALKVVLFYAAWFAPAGVVAAAIARRCEWPWRMLNLLLVVGAGFFFMTAWLNVALLPGFTSALSLFVDVVLAAVAVSLLVVRYRAPGEDLPHGARWFRLALASCGIALVFSLVLSGRGEGASPTVAVRQGTPARPNVLLVLVDTMRADHLGCYGYKKATSSEFDRFAADATRFKDCRAVTSWTKPSIASLFTSMYPTAHACREQREVLVPEAETLAEVFRAAGWRTGAFVDNPFISPEFGFGQGFDRFEGIRPSVPVNGSLLGKALFMTRIMSLVGRPFGVGEREGSGSEALNASLVKFAADGKAPWFAYVHAMEPHLPYRPSRADAEAMGFPAGENYADPPHYNGILPFQTAPKQDPALVARLVAQYDGEIRGWSRQFGKLIDTLKASGAYENTVIVVMADHGEEFGEHGGWTHGHSLHREVTQVPLVVRVPDMLTGSRGDAVAASRGRVVEGTATLLDVFPTVLDLCGIEFPAMDSPSHSGASLVPEVLGTGGKHARDAVPDRTLLGEVTMSPVNLRSIREGRWQFIRAEQPMESARALWEDIHDVAHARDRIADEPMAAKEMEAAMDDVFRRLASIALTGGTRTIDAETAEALRKLGYFGGK